jgi:hypothetical protein
MLRARLNKTLNTRVWFSSLAGTISKAFSIEFLLCSPLAHVLSLPRVLPLAQLESERGGTCFRIHGSINPPQRRRADRPRPFRPLLALRMGVLALPIRATMTDRAIRNSLSAFLTKRPHARLGLFALTFGPGYPSETHAVILPSIIGLGLTRSHCPHETG